MSALHALGRYSWNLLRGFDRFANAVLGGDYRETMSSRTGRAQRAGKWWAVYLAAPVINAIMLNPKHCEEAIGT